MTKSFVVDASTCLKWIFQDEIDSEKALALQKEYLDEKIELLSPNIWVFEIANGIKTAFLRERIPINKCELKLNQLLESSPYLISVEDKIEACLNNALTYQISVYDSAYVTLAILNKVPLISTDSKLLKKINNPKITIALEDFKS